MLESVEKKEPDERVTVALIAPCRNAHPFEGLFVLFGPIEF
jgi:hypothetical protein